MNSSVSSGFPSRQTSQSGGPWGIFNLSMIAALLRELTPRHRAWATASMWLLVVTVLNVQTGGAYRSTLLFAIPVALVSWTNWQMGFVFSAIGVLAATYGGALPESGSSAPLWLHVTLAFTKLCIDAAVVNAWGRRRRRMATGAPAHDTNDTKPD
jgi:hypothetical protein